MPPRSTTRETAGEIGRFAAWLNIILCSLNGHELFPSFEPNRICLRCVSCQYETHGWTLNTVQRRQVPRAAVLVQHEALAAD
jgi:hypothetical protein